MTGPAGGTPADGTYVEPVVTGPPHAVVARPSAAKAHVDTRAVSRELASRILDDAQSKACGCGVERVEVATSDGDPVDGILERAHREDADAIVMGSRGLSDIKGLVMGSVSH